MGGGEWRLHERVRQALVEATDAALLVERRHGLARARAVAVLVVHGGAQPHEGDDLDHTGDKPREAAAERLGLRLGLVGSGLELGPGLSLVLGQRPGGWGYG